jgi:hypothetical protein
MEETKNLEDLTFVEKPTKKADKRTLGVLEEWEGTGFKQFIPRASGTGNKKTVVKSNGRCKLVKNEGEKESSFTIMANQSSGNANYAESLMEDVYQTLKPMLKKDFTLPVCKFAVDHNGLKVWHSKKRKKICVYVEMEAGLSGSVLAAEFQNYAYEVHRKLFDKKF